jgi:hypothetical protein
MTDEKMISVKWIHESTKKEHITDLKESEYRLAILMPMYNKDGTLMKESEQVHQYCMAKKFFDECQVWEARRQQVEEELTN